MQPLIRPPPPGVPARLEYLLRPRATRSFNTVLDAGSLMREQGRSTVTFERDDAGVQLGFVHPLHGGTIKETLTLVHADGGLRSQRLQRLVDDNNGVEVRREIVDFSSRALPLPGPTYPEVMLPFLLAWQPMDGQTRELYAWINDRFVATVQYQTQGETTLELPVGERRAIKALMWPDLNDWVPLGRMLTGMANSLVPKYHIWFDAELPHIVLRFEGPYGPPGAPEITLELAGKPG